MKNSLFLIRYDPTLRVDYRVECGSDSQNALFKVTYLDMQNESDCTDESGNNRSLILVCIYS